MPKTPDFDNRTISTWRVDRKIHLIDDGFDDVASIDQAPPLWKDLTLASVVAVLLWAVATAVFV